MGSLCDKIQGDRNTLYYIGNGFDLFHGVKTKFIHFYSWLNLKDENHEMFASKMENIFLQSSIHGNSLWTDFEKALGNFDVDMVHQSFSGIEENRIFDEAYQKRAASYVHEPFSKIASYLNEWAKQINIESVHPILPIGKESLYLSFNYTLLLENVYKICCQNIFHIHHSIQDSEPLIVGHNKEFPHFYDYTENINIQKSQENLSQEINQLKKPTSKIIGMHKKYFNSLSNITKVVVFGHSLSCIDKPYFDEVLHNVQDNAKWVFVVYDSDAKVRYQKIVYQYNKYFNDPKILGVSQYKSKIVPQNCDYISINELKTKIAYE